MSNSVQPYWLRPARLLCPQDAPGKNIRVGCHAFLQGIFLTQGWKLCLLWLHWQVGSLPNQHHLGNVAVILQYIKYIKVTHFTEEEKWQPTLVESHVQRSLVRYSPWGCKELDMTQRLNNNMFYTLSLHSVIYQVYSSKKINSRRAQKFLKILFWHEQIRDRC